MRLGRARIAGILAIALAFALLAEMFSRFWWVFAIPGALFVILQLFAFSNSNYRERAFKRIDYLYYILIAGVVTFGVRFFSQANQLEKFGAIKDKEFNQKLVARDDMEIPKLQQELDVVDAKIDALPKELLADAGAWQMREQQERAEGKSQNSPRLKLNPYQFVLDLEGHAAMLSQQINSLQQERADALRLLGVAASTSPSTTPGLASHAATDLPKGEIELEWAPMLALCGIAMKLGKTSASL
jgi:hypothetical protein